MGRWTKRILIALGVAFIAIQFVPYGHDHSNPPVVADAPWPSAQAEELARTSCYDCHSNETDWRFYTSVAPFSWWAQHDVDEGRGVLNFSDWDAYSHKAGEAAEVVDEGEMPPNEYTIIHWDARLSSDERQVLINALQAMEASGR